MSDTKNVFKKNKSTEKLIEKQSDKQILKTISKNPKKIKQTVKSQSRDRDKLVEKNEKQIKTLKKDQFEKCKCIENFNQFKDTTNLKYCYFCKTTELRHLDRDKWICDCCKDLYLKCTQCEDEGNITFDFEVNDKGAYCNSCYNHFCGSCFQHNGTFLNDKEEDILDSSYTCKKCLIEKNNKNTNKK